MRRPFSYSESEQRVTLASLNLFFSALLGANLGTMNEIPLPEYFKMVLLLVGAVTAILMIAVSELRAMILRIVLVLVAVALLASLGQGGTQREFNRLAITLAVWLGLLLLLRLSGFRGKDADEPSAVSDEV